MQVEDILIAGLGVAAGGFLKGATGVGAPVIGVPVLALVLGVPQAVAIFAVINFVSNIWQSWAFRGHLGTRRFYLGFAGAGAVGAALGSVLLVSLPIEALMLALSALVACYVVLRLARPDLGLRRPAGDRLAAPAGFTGGILQGAGGLSAPVSLTYLNALGLERGEFVATISIYFMALSVLQVPALIYLGVLTAPLFKLSLLAAIPLFAAMPLGALVGRYVSKRVFDRLILILLALIAVQLAWKALA